MSEVEFIEACLNQTASGQDMLLPFLLYALKQRMHIDDFLYYSELIRSCK